MSFVSYTPSLGANGDGNALQRTSATASLVPGSPSPGSGIIGAAIIPLKKVAATPAAKTTKKPVATKVPSVRTATAAPVTASDSVEEATDPDVVPIDVSGEVAAVASAPVNNLTPWVLGLMVFLGVATVAILSFRRRSRAAWDIVEDTSDTV